MLIDVLVFPLSEHGRGWLWRFCFPLSRAVVVFWQSVLGAEVAVAVGAFEGHVGFGVALLAFQTVFTWLFSDGGF